MMRPFFLFALLCSAALPVSNAKLHCVLRCGVDQESKMATAIFVTDWKRQKLDYEVIETFKESFFDPRSIARTLSQRGCTYVAIVGHGDGDTISVQTEPSKAMKKRAEKQGLQPPGLVSVDVKATTIMNPMKKSVEGARFAIAACFCPKALLHDKSVDLCIHNPMHMVLIGHRAVAIEYKYNPPKGGIQGYKPIQEKIERIVAPKKPKKYTGAPPTDVEALRSAASEMAELTGEPVYYYRQLESDGVYHREVLAEPKDDDLSSDEDNESQEGDESGDDL